MKRARVLASSAIAVVGLSVGLAAPALALYRDDDNQDFTEGNGENESVRWTDSTPNYTDSRVTVLLGCNRDFTVTIREDRTLEPDPNRGSEWVNCTDYSDAVLANTSTNYDKKHHYDGTDIGLVSAKPYVPKHALFDAIVRW